MNITGLSHISIVVPNLKACDAWFAMFPRAERREHYSEDQGVTAILLEVPGATIEFVVPNTDDSPVSEFLRANPRGGVHHICFRSENLEGDHELLQSLGIRTLTPQPNRGGANGGSFLFLNPRQLAGVLVELDDPECC